MPTTFDFDRLADAVSRLRAHDWLNPGFGHRWWPEPDLRPLRPAPWAPVFVRLSAGVSP